jgi:hypothetical protein
MDRTRDAAAQIKDILSLLEDVMEAMVGGW